MKFLSRLLLLCLLGWGALFAQTIAPNISASNCEKPEYPSASKRLTEEGTVQLKFLVGVDGKVIDSAVEKSSGFRRLDEAARQGLSKCTFRPGSKNGTATESWASMKYTWRLEVFAPCVGGDISNWNRCLGMMTSPTGGLSVIEYENGKKSGRGIEYDQDGNLIRAGLFEGENLVYERSLDTKLFPFRSNLVNSAAQIIPSSLQPCHGIDAGKWINCFGTVNYGEIRYVGEFKDGKMGGQGIYTFPNGDKYVGAFENGLYSGKGTFTLNYGDKYVGEFKNGKRHGQAIYYASNGKVVLEGIWVNDTFVRSEQVQQVAAPSVIPGRAERDRLSAEVEAERKKRQELEAQLAATHQPITPQTNTLGRTAYALVIGNAAYPGSGRLENPVNDANAISQKLRSMGFTVTTVTDANRQRLVQSMAQFRRTAAAADISLLYYAGHGVQIFGTNYILPTDVDQTDPAQATIRGVSLNSVVENFLPGKTKLVFLDACRDNALQRTNDRSVSKGLAPISAAEGTLISYATKDGQTAADGVGSKNSPFTQALLEHLNDPQDIAVVLRKVRERVMKITGGKQQPWEYGSLTGGELVLSAIKPK